MAKTKYQSLKWSCGDIRVDRVVNKRGFTSSRSQYWWPRRKDDGSLKDAAINEENANIIDGCQAEDQGLYESHFRSRRYEPPKRIHIIGVGSLGAFVAHSLAGIANRPSITLLLRRRRLRMWKHYGCSIEIITHGMKETRRGFEVEAVRGLLEESSIPAENHSQRAEDLPNENGTEAQGISLQTGAEGQEDSLPRGLTTKNGDVLAVKAPTLEESNLLADDSLQQDIQGDDEIPEESVSEAGQSSMPEREINAWFAQAEQEVDEAHHQEKGTSDPEQMRTPDEHEDTIHHLIVSVKAPQTVKAIQAVAHRLTQDSSILFLQNGMGIVDEVNKKIFPDERYRPTYIAGVVSHGLYSKGPFSAVHAGEGTIALGVLPRMPIGESIKPEAPKQLSPSSRYLMRTMTRTAVFVAVGFARTAILQQQLDKLAVNCIINPLTAILDCKNGDLLKNYCYRRVFRLLLAEISLVIKSLPELKNVPNVNMRFDTLRLEMRVFSIAKTTADNYSSMLQDIRSGRPTEIDYINGYIVKRGEEMGIHCVLNYMLMHMVKGKNKIISHERADLLPLASQRNEAGQG